MYCAIPNWLCQYLHCSGRGQHLLNDLPLKNGGLSFYRLNTYPSPTFLEEGQGDRRGAHSHRFCILHSDSRFVPQEMQDQNTPVEDMFTHAFFYGSVSTSSWPWCLFVHTEIHCYRKYRCSINRSCFSVHFFKNLYLIVKLHIDIVFYNTIPYIII